MTRSNINLIAILAVIIAVLFFVGQGSEFVTNAWLKKIGMPETPTTEEVVKK